jgi:hypothetical protein
MVIVVIYHDEYQSVLRSKEFYSWNQAIPFCEYLHSKNLFVDTRMVMK